MAQESMAARALATVTFVDADGSPLPEWLQSALRRQMERLPLEFPRLSDPAVRQNLLDRVGQRIKAKAALGVHIEHVEAYVEVAARNAALDICRRVDPLYRSSLVDSERAAVGPNAVADAVAGSEVFDRARKQLSPEEQEILIRYAVEGEKHREIAAALGLEHDTVRRKYSRALAKLRECFGVEKMSDAAGWRERYGKVQR